VQFESDGDSTLSEPELQFTKTKWDEIAPESPDEEDSRVSDGTSVSHPSRRTEDTDNPHWSSWWGWDEKDSKASDGTSVSHRSRRTEDTDNPHWSSRWAGWGLTAEYLDDGYGDHDETEYLGDVVTEFNSLHLQAEVLVEQPDDISICPIVAIWMTAQPDITGLVGAWSPPGEDELLVHEDASDASSDANDSPVLV
jgi:hypothetical protein